MRLKFGARVWLGWDARSCAFCFNFFFGQVGGDWSGSDSSTQLGRVGAVGSWVQFSGQLWLDKPRSDGSCGWNKQFYIFGRFGAIFHWNRFSYYCELIITSCFRSLQQKFIQSCGSSRCIFILWYKKWISECSSLSNWQNYRNVSLIITSILCNYSLLCHT